MYFLDDVRSRPLIMYSRYLSYPQISSAFSGGQTQSVVLVIKPEQVDAAKVGGLVLSDDRKIALEIIFEGPDFLLITPPTGSANTPNVKAIRVRKDLIDAVLYLDRVAN